MLVYEATVTDTLGNVRATYRGELGTARSKGFAKVRQLMGRAVAKGTHEPYTYPYRAIAHLPWGDTARVAVRNPAGKAVAVEFASTLRLVR